MNDKYIELAKKLNTLANQGVAEGEKYNAKQALNSLMLKYKITFKDIEEETMSFVKFFSPSKYDFLFFQVALTVVEVGREAGTLNSNKNYKVVNVTKLEELEIRAKWNFYRKAFDEQMKIFMGAFIMKNQLWPKESENDTQPKRELTEEEKLHLIKSSILSNNLERSDYKLQIKS